MSTAHAQRRTALRPAASPAGRWGLAVAAVTALGFALRFAGFREGLFADELYLYEIATRDDLSAVLGRIHDTESTPPFHFLLAWLAGKLGDSTVLIRLPSLVLGTATIPLTYLLGARTIGRSAGLLGAAFFALSPFAIWYADEARAYATMGFLSVLAALALLRALETRSPAWWVVYAGSACLILYTHYMGVFVVVAAAGWAFWTQRDRWGELFWAHAAMAVAYVPWLPSFVVQSDDTSANRISTFKDFTPKGVVRELAISLDGHPFLPLSSVPGRAALVLFGLGAGAAAVGGVLLWRRTRPDAAPVAEAAGLGGRAALVMLLAAATPVGVALYSIVGKNTYIPRNLSASSPEIWLAVAAGLTGLRTAGPPALRCWAWPAATAALVVGLAIGTVRTLEPDRGRPPYRAAAQFVDSAITEGAAVVEYPLFPAFANEDVALGRHLQAHLERSPAPIQVRSPDSPGWDLAARAGRLLVVTPWDESHRAGGEPLPPRLRERFRLVEDRSWVGLVPVAAFVYARRR